MCFEKRYNTKRTARAPTSRTLVNFPDKLFTCEWEGELKNHSLCTYSPLLSQTFVSSCCKCHPVLLLCHCQLATVHFAPTFPICLVLVSLGCSSELSVVVPSFCRASSLCCVAMMFRAALCACWQCKHSTARLVPASWACFSGWLAGWLAGLRCSPPPTPRGPGSGSPTPLPKSTPHKQTCCL